MFDVTILRRLASFYTAEKPPVDMPVDCSVSVSRLRNCLTASFTEVDVQTQDDEQPMASTSLSLSAVPPPPPVPLLRPPSAVNTEFIHCHW